MTSSSVLPVFPDTAPVAAPEDGAEPDATARDFEEHLSEADDEADGAAPQETRTEDPTLPQAAVDTAPEDPEAPEPEVAPFLLAPVDPVEPPPSDPVQLAGQTLEAQVEMGTAPPAPEGPPELLDVEELPPAPARTASARTAGAGTDLMDLGGQSDDAPDGMGSDAAQAFDVESAELDGLIEPDAVVDAAPEPQDAPELPVPEPGRLRVTVDDDLAVEVSRRGGRIEVAVDGSQHALRELQDLGPELAASLAELGFELGGFSQQERGGEGSEGEAGAGEEGAPAEREASGGRLVNTRA